jgi:hypothetical protein
MDLRIFLSSTFIDLRETRQKIIQLLSVIPSDVLRMEVFGSDESRPLEYCLDQVDRSNFFIGVYAERYGTIDPDSGKSITELEYEEAFGLHQRSLLSGLLVYVLDPGALWPVEQVDREPAQVSALQAFKHRLRQRHTLAFFKDGDSLALMVLRDVLRKIGIGPERALRPRRLALRAEGSARPLLGMEHFTERDSALFRGREGAVAVLAGLIDKEPITLLLGESGVGKTSLIQAGLTPLLRSKDYQIVLCRPLPAEHDIAASIWNQAMEGIAPASSWLAVIRLIATAQPTRQLCVFLDQFEDVLSLPVSLESWANQLTQLHETPLPTVHFVISYRGDAEARLGAIWQRVSGSPTGLPRYYLRPLTAAGAANAISAALHAADVTLARELLLNRIITDLNAASIIESEGDIYPPLVQMVLGALVSAAKDYNNILDEPLYESLGGTAGIIGRYLTAQLQLLGPKQASCRLVLTSLVSSKRRTTKALAQIAEQTGLDKQAVADSISELLSCRLIRAVGDGWEIVHDYLAAKVADELLAPEEHDLLVLRDLLYAKAATFERTAEFLTTTEYLGIYFHRAKIAVGAAELRLVLASSAGKPIHYFLRNTSEETRLNCLTAPEPGDDEEVVSDEEVNRRLQLLRNQNQWHDPYGRLRWAPVLNDARRVLSAFRSQRDERSEVAIDAALNLPVSEQQLLIERLCRSRTPKDTRLLFALASRGIGIEALAPNDDINSRHASARMIAYCRLAVEGGSSWAPTLRDRMKQSRGMRRREKEVAAYCLAYWAQRTGHTGVLKALLRRSANIRRATLAALDADRGGLTIDDLLSHYATCPVETSAAVLRTVQQREWSKVARFVRQIRLTDSSRSLMLSICKLYDVRALPFLLELIAEATYKVFLGDLWGLERALRETVVRSLRGSLEAKEILCEIVERQYFWEWDEYAELPVVEPQNLYLYKRLAGVCLAVLCERSDWPILKRLVYHSYFPVRAAAITKVLEFAGVEELNELVLRAPAAIGGGLGPIRDAVATDVLSALDYEVYAGW